MALRVPTAGLLMVAVDGGRLGEGDSDVRPRESMDSL